MNDINFSNWRIIPGGTIHTIHFSSSEEVDWGADSGIRSDSGCCLLSVIFQ